MNVISLLRGAFTLFTTSGDDGICKEKKIFVYQFEFALMQLARIQLKAEFKSKLERLTKERSFRLD